MQRGIGDRKAVCLSVCLSVKRANCDETKAPSEKVQLRLIGNWDWNELSIEPKTNTVHCRHCKPPQGASKAIFFVFRIKNWAFLEESLLKSVFV